MLIILGSSLFSATEKTFAAVPIEDIVLNPTGTLQGRVLGATTEPGIKIEIYRERRLIAKITTDSDGTFQFPKMQAGNYRLQWSSPSGKDQYQLIRLWNHRQAPPSAKHELTLPMTVVRGQYGDAPPAGGSTPNGGMRRIFRNPWITAAILSTAIAVPIAVTHGDDSAS